MSDHVTLRAAAVESIAGIRSLVAAGRTTKADEYLRHGTVWQVLDAIAAGCDDPGALTRETLALRDEVEAAQR